MRIDGKAGAQIFDLLPNGFDDSRTIDVVKDVAHPASELRCILFLEASSRYCRRANADPAGNKRGLWVVRHGVLVHGDMRCTQCGICRLSGQTLRDEADKEQV